MSFRFGDFELDLERRQLLRSGEAVPLEPKAYELLCLLVGRRPRALSRAQIRDVVWPGVYVSESTLGVVVNAIREALDDDARQPRFIRTVHGFGYAFCGEAREEARGATEASSGAIPDRAGAAAGESPAGEAMERVEGGTRAGLDARPADRPARTLPRRWRTLGLSVLGLAALGIPGYWLTRQPPPRVLHVVQMTNDGQAKSFYHRSGRLVTDGSRVYFVAEDARGGVIHQVSTTGGETAPLPTQSWHFPTLADISPRRAELLVMDTSMEGEAPLWVLPLAAGPPRRLGNLHGHDGGWSPDGERLVYANGSGLFLAGKDGADPRPLVNLAGRPWFPRWSPDGTRVRFSLTDLETDTDSLWEVSAAGTDLRPLLPGWNNPPAECCGNWTPDGRYFVFVSTRAGKTNIWALRERGGLFREATREPLPLTATPLDLSAPVPSLDGSRLFVLGTKRRGELVRYDAKAGQFVPYLKGLSALDVDFSRDGQWVTYAASPDRSLWRSRVDGGERLLLAPAPMEASLPRWSPDGKRIAFIGRSPAGVIKIYLVPAEGGSPEPAMPGERHEADPGWSPDGSSLVFCRLPWLEPGGPDSIAIQVLDLTTHHVSTIPGSKGLYSPRWSPDGRYIAALAAGPEHLMLFDRTTESWTELARITVGSPNWSRDGKHVYFNAPTQDSAFVRVRVSDRKLERLVSLEDIRQVGFWSGLAPDDSPLVVRDVGTQEIYALEWEAP
jgi:Tol biopolymer transport system component/DNA-binding winged helix-turn-helix (wHTH) protein